MIESRTLPATIVTAYFLWVAAFGVFFLGGLAFASEHWHLAVLVSNGGCILSAVAATFHIKHYAQGLCLVIRDRDALHDDIRRLQRIQ